jgi:hypothetical protein
MGERGVLDIGMHVAHRLSLPGDAAVRRSWTSCPVQRAQRALPVGRSLDGVEIVIGAAEGHEFVVRA